ncbi:MAG TPA: D-hexose-6-phosphate mutarotase [Pseudomonadales bacterium]
MFLSTITERQLSPTLTVLDIENAHATATISLLGAQVLSFKPKHDGRERLFVSDKAIMDGSKPVRGGIPVCWPWFGAHGTNPEFPAHGFVRSRTWKLVGHEDDDTCTRIVLEAPDTSHPGFTGRASLKLEVELCRELTLKLHTRNTGKEPLKLSMALHTYFSVDDVRECRLDGLHGTYSDKTRNWAMLETPEPYVFSEETDRVHLHAARELRIVEPRHTIKIGSEGHDSIVVWNPWSTGVGKFADMSSDGWERMLCVETASTQGLELSPGEAHQLQQTIA